LLLPPPRITDSQRRPGCPARSSPPPPSDLHARLELLYLERALAAVEGLAADSHYMADLDDEIIATRHAYAAITEIATFRAQLSGPLHG
jgi:hypothetical protein